MISIVLPCMNELRHGYLPRILENLVDQAGPKEIIAVVSPSQDNTVAVIQQYSDVKLIQTTVKNRAERLNIGIQASQGNIILLHHPATLLPQTDALRMLRQVLANPEIAWGGFHQSFDLDHWLLRFTSWYSNYQRARRGILYLDHCIFVRKDALVAIQGVPEIDIFEDTILSQKLCQFGLPQLAPGTVTTSARRFRERGIVRHAMINQILKLCYYAGINPQYLNRVYERRSQINKTYKD